MTNINTQQFQTIFKIKVATFADKKVCLQSVDNKDQICSVCTGAEMKFTQATRPPETRYVSVRPEEETMIAGSRGRTSIDFLSR